MSTVHPDGAGAPGPLFWVLSVDKPGLVSTTRSGTYTPRPGATREDAYQEIYEEVTATASHPALRGATVLFFSLEPNRL
ncbi:hypothetical protein [Streptomyces sp. SLBN-31]|uniref:hypothetical protein n=1 Tax=Streptomyces sp. SLBN-31 TaxID=2768444 RepID=UPI00115400D3|nr:hypothetical protein [Streptomyces sp. SLBN-31]TQJ89314.1 hypothetical protein FBY22_0073 [Streptomyces sp. SLBN-31]